MRFRAGVNEVTVRVSIRDTGLVEETEKFYIGLEVPSAYAELGVVKDSSDHATVVIADDDGECCFWSLYNSAHN